MSRAAALARGFASPRRRQLSSTTTRRGMQAAPATPPPPPHLQRGEVGERGLPVPVAIQQRGVAGAARRALHQRLAHAAPAAQEEQVDLQGGGEGAPGQRQQQGELVLSWGDERSHVRLPAFLKSPLRAPPPSPRSAPAPPAAFATGRPALSLPAAWRSPPAPAPPGPTCSSAGAAAGMAGERGWGDGRAPGCAGQPLPPLPPACISIQQQRSLLGHEAGLLRRPGLVLEAPGPPNHRLKLFLQRQGGCKQAAVSGRRRLAHRVRWRRWVAPPCTAASCTQQQAHSPALPTCRWQDVALAS